MDEAQAQRFVRSLTISGGPPSGQAASLQWQDPTHIATAAFRFPAVKKLSRETIYDPTESMRQGVHPGVAVVEIYLTEPLPDIEYFWGIFAVDEFGIWFSDNAESIDLPVGQQRVIPWRYVKGLVLHQRTL